MTRNPRKRRPGAGCCASLLTLALAVGGMACSDPVPITGPGPAPTAPPAGSWVVRGTVFEDLPVSPDVRPLAGAPLRVFGGGRIVEVISGADGSYEADMPATASFVRVVASGPQYFSPCPSFRWGGASRVEGPMDVHVISGATVSTMNRFLLPNQINGGDNLTWGRVVEPTSRGLEPVAGATVTLRGVGHLENPVAATVSDAKGSWALCSADAVRAGTVEARKEGYAPASISAVYGWELDYVDLELVLTRQ